VQRRGEERRRVAAGDVNNVFGLCGPGE